MNTTNKIKLIQKLNKNKHKGYSLLKEYKELHNDKEIELAYKYDLVGYISKKIGKEIETLYQNKDYLIGIKYIKANTKILNNIFKKGLRTRNKINIQSIIKEISNPLEMNISLKKTSSYKNKTGCLILKIPKSYLGRKEGEILPIYTKNKNSYYILTEYIYGYIPVDKYIIKEIIQNPNYKEKHTPTEDKLYYEINALIKEKENLIELKETIEEYQYQILYKSYKDTYKKYGHEQAKYALLNFINNNTINNFTGINNRVNLKTYINNQNITKILSNHYQKEDNKNIIEDFIKEIESNN